MVLDSENSDNDSHYQAHNHHQHHYQEQQERLDGQPVTMLTSSSTGIMMTTFHNSQAEECDIHHHSNNSHQDNGQSFDNHDTGTIDHENSNIYNTNDYTTTSTTATATSIPPSNEQLLGVAFLTFFTFAMIQMIYAIHIVHSQAMMGDSAAMLVDSFTYLFNYVAERQKSTQEQQQQHHNNMITTTMMDDDLNDIVLYESPNHYRSNTNNTGTDDNGNNINQMNDTGVGTTTTTTVTLKRQQQQQQQTRHDRKMVLQLEIIPPLVSVTTLIIVTIFVTRKAMHILILDIHRSKAQQTIPNLHLMFLFSCFNLLLDLVNVLCFARAKHCCGYSTTTSLSSNHNHNHKHHHHNQQHQKYFTSSSSNYNNNSNCNEEGDEENSAHSGTHLLEDTTITSLQQKQQQQQHPSLQILQAVKQLPLVTRGYAHVPTMNVVAISTNGNHCDNNGRAIITNHTVTSSTDAVTLPQNAPYENNEFLIRNNNNEDDDEDENHVIIENYDRYVELLQQGTTEDFPTRSASTGTADQIHKNDANKFSNGESKIVYSGGGNRHFNSEGKDVPADDHDTTNLNMCSAYTHVFADTLRSIAVIIAAIVAELVPSITPEVADSTAAILVSILILLSLVPLIQGLINSCQELHTIYLEEKMDATATMLTMHPSTTTMDHLELT